MMLSLRPTWARRAAAPIVFVAFMTLVAAALTVCPAPVAAAPGVPLWTRPVPATKYADGISKVVPAPNGGVYAIGWKNQTGLVQVLYVARLSARGRVVWSRTYSYSLTHTREVREPLGVVDSAGNLIAACKMLRPGRKLDMAVVKYSPSGQRLWARMLDGPAHLDDIPVGLGVDLAKNVYVAGTSAVSGGTTIRAFKLRRSDGAVIWRYVRPAPLRADELDDMAVRADGTSFLTGTTPRLLARAGAPQDGVTFSLSPEGEPRWTQREIGAGSFNGAHVAVVPGGGCRVARPGQLGYLVVSYDDAGSRIGLCTLPPLTGLLSVKGLAVAPDGDTVLVTGSAAVSKVGPDGTLRWTTVLGSGGMLAYNDLVTDSAGSIYVTGSKVSVELRTHKLSALGALQWTWTKKSDGWGRSLAITSAGSLYMGGSLRDGDGGVIRFIP